MQNFLRDLRYSLRLLRRTPGFTLAAIAVLALGIGANTAIFSLVHEMIWSPRPYAHADRIVQLYTQNKSRPGDFRLASYPVYQELTADGTVFDGLLAYNLAMVGVGNGQNSRRTFSAVVSSNYFSVLGVQLARGRTFLPEEERPGSDIAVAIASYQYWKKTGFDPGLIGSTLRINEHPFTIVGIAPEHFTGTMMLFSSEFYFPLGVYDRLANDFGDKSRRALEHADSFNLFLLGRLKPGRSIEEASVALRTIATRLESAHPVEQKDQTLFVAVPPRLGANTNPSSEPQLKALGTLLLAMSGLVLLVACLNLATMQLARGTARRKEIAVRLALGGGQGRIVRQLLTEAFVLALAGGTAGFLLASWSTRLLVNSLTALVPFELHFRGVTNPAILGATLAFCTLATLGFALGPALKLTRSDTYADLKQQAGEDPVTRRRRWWPRHPLVVAQLAVSLALLTAAGLFVRSAVNAARFDTGFRPSTVIAEVDASLARFDRVHGLQLYQNLTHRLAAMPGVEAVGVGSLVPLGNIQMNRGVRRAGLAPAADARPATAAEGRAFDAGWNSVGAAYFQAIGLPILRGRAFTAIEAEQEGAPPVAIVDELLARQLFPEGDALGQRVAFGDAGKEDKGFEIVGIVPTTRWELFAENARGSLYQPFAQAYQGNAFFHVRAAATTPEAQRALFDSIRHEIREAAPTLPIFGVQTFAQHLSHSVQVWLVRAGGVLFAVFGGLALLLAVVGVYGVKAYAVSRRTREIGIRMALGAEPRAVHRLILRESATMTVTGIVLGLFLGGGIGLACRHLLFEVGALDPLAFALASIVLGSAALVACWFPARRATKVNPLVALRSE